MLVRHGVEYVFGILGREAQAIRFDEPGLKFILTRHEFTAGVACDSYARVTGKAQACFSTFGPGATNLSTGIASSFLDRSPMLALSAQIETGDAIYGHVHQCVDQVAMMRPITKYAAELESAVQIPAEVQKALSAAYSELLGPAYLSLPVDVLLADVADAEAHRIIESAGVITASVPPHAEDRTLREVHALLSHAQRAVAVVGNTVFRENAVTEFRAFVRKYNLPVVSSLASKGALPDSDPQNIGPVNRYLNGILKRDILDDVFGNTDLVLLIGFDIAEDVRPAMYSCGRPKTIVRLSSTPNLAMKSVKVNVDVVGDIKRTLARLGSSHFSATGSFWAGELTRDLRAWKMAAGEEVGPTMSPAPIIRAVRDVIGREGILCSDVGLHKQYAGLMSETEEANTFLCSNGLGSFGSGLPLALGAKLARPAVPVAAVVGDGGFHSNSADLETLARHRIPVVVVVLNDSAFGMIKHYQIRGDQRSDNIVNLLPVNFAALAEANNCRGLKVTSNRSLRTELAAAVRANEPTVIEVPVDYDYQM
jgi:acetolactate synthase-1/2/3 large subunit/N2-(2-carboxyethyl)arginine synthase